MDLTQFDAVIDVMQEIRHKLTKGVFVTIYISSALLIQARMLNSVFYSKL